MKALHTPFLTAAVFAASFAGALAQDADYVDNRSDGAALVRSLYNAIERKEYARAYSYFADGKVFGDYKSFVDGYANTVAVKVVTGTVRSEGAAGSIYAPVPVAVEAAEKGGKIKVYAGCYITRIVSAAIQEPPFTPLHIDSAELAEVELPLNEALPKACRSPS